MTSKAQTFAVIGLGTFGGTVARDLARFGNTVIGVDHKDRHVEAHAEDLTQCVIADAREINALRETGIEGSDVGIVAIGTDIEASILSVINLRSLGVGTIWAKATSKNHHRILSKMGVDRVIHPEKEVGQHIAQVLHNPLVRDYVSLGNGYHVVNFRVPESLQGKALGALDHTSNHNLRCVGVMRGTSYCGDDGTDCTLQKDDLLLLLGNRQDLRRFADSL